MNEMRSTVWCTNCRGSFVATFDLDLNGNHEITCPLCAHVHYRVVRDGVVTEDRWRSSGQPTYIVATTTTVTVGSSFNTTTTFSTEWLSRSDMTT